MRYSSHGVNFPILNEKLTLAFCAAQQVVCDKCNETCSTEGDAFVVCDGCNNGWHTLCLGRLACRRGLLVIIWVSFVLIFCGASRFLFRRYQVS
jgi:hypothetical protein